MTTRPATPAKSQGLSKKSPRCFPRSSSKRTDGDGGLICVVKPDFESDEKRADRDPPVLARNARNDPCAPVHQHERRRDRARIFQNDAVSAQQAAHGEERALPGQRQLGEQSHPDEVEAAENERRRRDVAEVHRGKREHHRSKPEPNRRDEAGQGATRRLHKPAENQHHHEGARDP
jgi:hypothetical protein